VLLILQARQLTYKPSTVAVLGRNLLVSVPLLVYWFSAGGVVVLVDRQQVLEEEEVAGHITMLGLIYLP
jgi:hypothetical protein